MTEPTIDGKTPSLVGRRAMENPAWREAAMRAHNENAEEKARKNKPQDIESQSRP